MASLAARFEGLQETKAFQFVSSGSKRARRKSKDWMLRRRRARASRKKTANRKTTYTLAASLLALLALFAWSMQYMKPFTPGRELTLSQLSALAGEFRIEEAHLRDEDAYVVGTFTAKPLVKEAAESTDATGTTDQAADSKATGEAPKKGADEGKAERKADESKAQEPAPPAPTEPEEVVPQLQAPKGSGSFHVAYPSDGSVTAIITQMLIQSGAKVELDAQTPKKIVRIVSTFLLPLMILANLFALLFTASKGSSSGIGEVIMFASMGGGKFKGRKKGPGLVNFSSVAGADEAVAELKEVVDYLKDPERYESVGATPPKGVLLFGPPGCGKTLLAKSVAGEAGVPFFSVAGAEFVESLVGVGAARVRDLFARVRAVAPAIVFIDELDAAGRKRGTGGGGGGSDEREQTLNQILVEMDGFEVSAGIVIIGATNRPDILDPAILRPGRFDRHVTVDQPDMVGRQLILELHSTGKPIAPTVDFSYLARRTPGFSGADLANVINEAALLTVRESKAEIEMPELEEAVQRVLAGPKKRGRVLTPEERKRAAYHESGHAVVAAASGRLEEIHRVSILARGRGIGMASIQQETDAALLTKDQIRAQIVTALGGFAAEELVFGVPSTGAEQDLEHATDLARDMVGRYGMGSRRRRLLSKEGESFLGDELGLGQISGQTHHEMENEMDDLLSDAERAAHRLLVEHREVLDTLADRLETEETLEGSDLEALLALVRPEVSLFGGLLDENKKNGETTLTSKATGV